MFQTSRIFTEEIREIFKHDKRFIQLGMKQSCSARGVCWDTASMESANGVLKTECLYNKFVKSKFKDRQGLSLARAAKLGAQMSIWFARAESFGICFLSSFAEIALCQNSGKRAV